MNMPMTNIVGNEKLRRRLCDDVLTGTVSHSYIISGPRGSGKYTVAMMFSAALACENKGVEGYALPCCNCPSCKKILENKSPDVYTVEKDGASVKIAQIRALEQEINFRPNELEYKIYVIRDAHTMTEQAQNALLLTLEEPPPYVIFLLLCESEENLLETVKSRAPLFRTEPVSGDMLKKFLLDRYDEARRLESTKPRELDAIISIANGSVGRAIELIDENTRQPYIKQRETATELVQSALSKNVVRLTETVLSLPTKQDELFPIFNCAKALLRDLILLKKSETAELCFYTDRERATELSYSASLSSLFDLYTQIEKTVETLQRNANIKLTLSVMLANIQ